jgi:hypothetical protein
MVGPMGNLTIVTQSSKQVNNVKAAKSDSEFLDPPRKILCEILSLNFNSHKYFQICWTATNLGEWHNIAK